MSRQPPGWDMLTAAPESIYYDAFREGALARHVHYRSKVWDHLEMTLFFKEKHCFFNKVNRNQKYTLYIVNVVNDYSRWKRLVSNEISP